MIRYLIIIGLTLAVLTASAQQGCPEVSINVTGQDTIINCCGTLTTSYVPNAQTSSYTVGQIPYAPFPFTGSNTVFVNTDDIWSGVITLPFTFCFYGNTYTQCVIGANGLISFNLAYANQYCQYPINAAIPSTQNPINSIMSPYHDIDPGVGGNVNYQVYGTAPCRTLVVNWNQIPMYSCNSMINTQQMVIYETTNVIETYIANKPLCASWNGGAAIHGIQNAAGTLATVVPGRNFPTNWTASNDAWRFTPSGGASNVSLNWYASGDSANILSTTPSLQVCPTDTIDYVIQAIYTPCVGLPIIVYDTVTVIPATTTITGTSQSNVLCNGGATGSASITYQTTATSPLSIWWNPPISTTTSISNVPAGNYTVYLAPPGSTMPICTLSYTFIITEPPVLNVNVSNINEPCLGDAKAYAVAIGTGGVSPYSYSWLNNPSISDTAFNLLAGTYTSYIIDGNNCVASQNFTITEPPLLGVNIVNTNNLCFGDAKALAVATSNGGTLPYTYSWTNNPSISDSAFNLSAGNYIGYVIDNHNCIASQNFTVAEPPKLIGSAKGDTICIGFSDGTAAVIINGGVQPYNYLWSNGVSTTSVASNLPAGVYLIEVTDANGCKITQSAEVIASTLPVISDVSIQNVRCFGEKNAIISTDIQQGGAPFTYSWNPFVSTAPNAINLGVGDYLLEVIDHFNCRDTMQFTVTEPPLLEATVSFQNVRCYNAKNGIGDIVLQGGTPPYNYTWNTNPPQYIPHVSLDTGIYMITASDAHNCQFMDFISIIQPEPIAFDVVEKIPSYCGLPNGAIYMSASGGTGQLTYSWENHLSQDTMLLNVVGNHNYTLFVTDKNDCRRQMEIKLDDIPRAEAAFITYPTNAEALFVNTEVHFFNQSKKAKSYLWLFGDGDYEVNINPIHTYYFPDSLTAMLIAYNGSNYCPDTAKMDFIIVPNGVLWFPNVFSPNQDLVNDVYSVKGVYVNSFNMKIFDRWGKEITELSSVNDSWDGTKNGEPCPEGVYTYIAWGQTIHNTAYKKSGTITLVR